MSVGPEDPCQKKGTDIARAERRREIILSSNPDGGVRQAQRWARRHAQEALLSCQKVNCRDRNTRVVCRKSFSPMLSKNCKGRLSDLRCRCSLRTPSRPPQVGAVPERIEPIVLTSRLPEGDNQILKWPCFALKRRVDKPLCGSPRIIATNVIDKNYICRR
jgi:hypothetical protein